MAASVSLAAGGWPFSLVNPLEKANAKGGCFYSQVVGLGQSKYAVSGARYLAVRTVRQALQ